MPNTVSIPQYTANSAADDFRSPTDGLGGFKVAPALHMPQEIELQYVVPHWLGATLKRGHPPLRLTTHYFPKGVEVVRDILTRAGVHEALYDSTRLTTIRLRETIFSSGASEYRLECKGPKERSTIGRLARSELSFVIDMELFKELVPEASSGTVEKLRHGIPGYIFSSDAIKVPVVLELDYVLRAGAPPRRLKTPLYRADIEIPHLNLVDDVRAGRTTFQDLHQHSIELSALDRESAKLFSYSALAIHGFSPRIERRYNKLFPSSRRSS